MLRKLKMRLMSAACAAAMILLPVTGTFSTSVSAENGAVTESADDRELSYQSIELYPSGEEAEQVITLEGYMPEGAEAEAVDVSDERGALAAFDITIRDGEDEYQPAEGELILVEIADPVLAELSEAELWHVADDGTREQITEFTLADGVLTFYAEGFSIYEIVTDDNVKPVTATDKGWQKLTDLSYLADHGDEGFYICYKSNDGRFAMNSVTENIKNTEGRTGLSVTNGIKDNNKKGASDSNVNGNQLIQNAQNAGASLYYFQPTDDGKYYIYCKDASGENLYVKSSEVKVNNTFIRSLDLVSDVSDASRWTLGGSDGNFTLQDTETKLYWNNTYENNKPYGFAAYTDPQNFIVWRYVPLDSDPYNLDGKTYGLMNYVSGTHGYALVAEDENVHSLIQLVMRKSDNSFSDPYYVDEGSEATRWTFHKAGEDRYTLEGDTESGMKYLAVSAEGELTIADSAEEAAEFTVTPDSEGKKIRLSVGGRYVTYDGESSFVLTDTPSDKSYLNFISFANVDAEDNVVYSADRISVSDDNLKTGDRVIVYTRIWNEDTLKYDMYAVDYNGTLYPCYASGGKILWLADGTGSLEWEFTEYVDPVTKQPNYYYELYNPYSEKYFAPQLGGGQVLSENNIGINMQGRRNDDFYTKITAWDKSHYSYVGLRPNADNSALEPCAEAVSADFYFATLEPLNLSDRLHEVATVDNNDHGITIKMQDFGTKDEMCGFLGSSVGGAVKTTDPNLLSTDIGADGYPKITKGANAGQSLAGLYNSPTVVNHLFIESVYNSSGYFEFDSCQNTATLCNEDGTMKSTYNVKDHQGNIVPTVDFTVYRELGTDNNKGITHQHGQFFPYNTIIPGYYSSENEYNMYDSLQNELSNDDPRKKEKLYRYIYSGSQPNCYNGMELDASFVQTASGLDAWGHDIIFEFTGDDDFWLYVDNELVIDLGGIHSALEGKVNFRTGKVNVNGKETTLRELFEKNYIARGLSETERIAKLDELFELNKEGQYIFKDYSTHTMKIFYMERGAGASNLHMRFNLASVTPGHVVVSKEMSGEGASEIDTDFVEYPFQIFYTLPEGENGEPGDEISLENGDSFVGVTYQTSNQPVTFMRKYRPPGVSEEDAYENVYFINPTKNAEISFPDNAIGYRIVECAVDNSIYENVLINGEEVGIDGKSKIDFKGNLRDYDSGAETVELRPSISFENFVRKDVIKDLRITKKLLDEDGNEITDDDTTFDFRLYLSPVNVPEDEIPPANMHSYLVLTPEGNMCRNDPLNEQFVDTGVEYSSSALKALPDSSESGELAKTDVVFSTSGFGSISRIPAGYTICVPGLPPGTVFKVTEDIKSGYGLKEYVMVKGTKIDEDYQAIEIPSYLPHITNNTEDPNNIGVLRAETDARLEVHNMKGYGLTVNKKWSDLDLTTAHDPIYFAVYVDGVLLEDSVKQVKSPSVSAYYFWTSLKKEKNGTERTSLDGYVVKEVILSGTPEVDSNGNVTNAGKLTVTPLNSGGKQTLTATRTASATPEGEDSDKRFDYIVSYQQGEDDGSSRTDTVTNTREGGIAVRLFRWNSDTPLSGGIFTLKDSTGKELGSYTSDSEGLVTMMYDFKRGERYTLTQTTAPRGYVGLHSRIEGTDKVIQKPLTFVVNDDDSVSLFYSDGTEWGTKSSDDSRWANYKTGTNGITAFVDVYNKEFNFKIVKTDSAESELMLGGAHFALYKQAKTTINGLVKPKDAMAGFEDLVTANGEVVVCGGDSGRVITPGEKGSVYFLEETSAPFNYKKLDDDIIFRISAVGVPSLVDDAYNGRLEQLDDCFIYTLSVPNEKEDKTLQTLTIEKVVEGSFGNMAQDFDFTVKVENAGDGEDFKWAKNGEEQKELMPRTGGTFTMRHSDRVEIALPADVEVTVSEDGAGYEQTFRLGDSEPVKKSKLSFEFTESEKLTVTNRLDGDVATGIPLTFGNSLAITAFPMIMVGYIMYRRRRRTE
ncbi:MAG: SpaA isopeptide-forming pilin-related protein [Ruminococcus sp.]|nr:SpaA isopeptide-forming pilin-related protein [Ruminococcus sp.]